MKQVDSPLTVFKNLKMYEDRDLESFASDRACLELSKQGFKTTLLKSGLVVSGIEAMINFK